MTCRRSRTACSTARSSIFVDAKSASWTLRMCVHRALVRGAGSAFSATAAIADDVARRGDRQGRQAGLQCISELALRRFL